MKNLNIIDVEQTSLEWFESRRGKFTGSDIVNLIWEPEIYKVGDKKGTEKPAPKTFVNLVQEKKCESKYGITQHEVDTRAGRCVFANYKPSIGINGEYGRLMESDALEYYAKKYSEEIYTVGFVISNEYPDHLGCSPDALHTVKNSGVEVKCPVTLSVHDANLSLKTAQELKELNDRYYWQVLCEMFVCEADSWDFVSYFPFVNPEFVMSCLVINRNEVKEDLQLLEDCIKRAINLKTA